MAVGPLQQYYIYQVSEFESELELGRLVEFQNRNVSMDKNYFVNYHSSINI